MTLDYSSIGLRIKHARKKRSWSQEQLAELVDISREHISRIESGEKGISLELLVAISNTLEVSITELLIDNLTNADSLLDSDLHYILLDCTAQEEKIIAKTALALKEILFEQGI